MKGGYTTREVGELLNLPASTILAWTRSGLLSPRRGPHGVYLFSFQDVALLRGARALLEADVPTRRVREALESLRAQLPAGRPLSAVRIAAEGGRVVARDEGGAWDPGTGQIQLDFPAPRTSSEPEGQDPGDAAIRRTADRDADGWYDAGLDLEAESPARAKEAYASALAREPAHADAHLNLGRLLHEEGDLAAAEAHYRQALRADPHGARAFYNLGVVLEDQGRSAGAAEAYETALSLDPELAAAHFNLSRLYEAEGRETDALAHLVAYKRVLSKGRQGA